MSLQSRVLRVFDLQMFSGEKSYGSKYMDHQCEIHYPIYVCSDWGTCEMPVCGFVVGGETVRILDLTL